MLVDLTQPPDKVCITVDVSWKLEDSCNDIMVIWSAVIYNVHICVYVW